ncbi:molecular chaperone [Actinobacillus porcinus]|uniref:TorD/DmsD family molecular chaperone n=1 Tax=Actinobacillus porcinus TaxID=51048 RepID=UPI0023562CDB|nr:molecular chaperone [Actinobacillus porcinus]MCI5763356.1 molecular chaperone [Actinobacillus porcinus]MDY6215594.1 molecular chaperone [Actinobacillus porcinus]
MSEQTLNNFSLISRLFGNLFYRAPSDEILAGVFSWLQQKGLEQVWALDTDKESQSAIESLQMPVAIDVLQKEYEAIFLHENGVSTQLSDYGVNIADFVQFRQERGMPMVESADHFGLVFLTASWIEDNLDSVDAQRQLFEQFLLPCANKFLSKVESVAKLPFYRSLAVLSREILAAMADELDEVE